MKKSIHGKKENYYQIKNKILLNQIEIFLNYKDLLITHYMTHKNK